MKIAYAGFDLLFPAFSALAEDGHDIIRIFSCRTDNICEFNTKITEAANRLGIPITYDRITPADLEELACCGCEALVCAGYYYRMPIDKRLRMVNIHPALLPVGRGAWPMPVTILKGLSESGVTIHKMEESFDTGDILIQRKFKVDKNEDLETFMRKVYALLPEMLHDLCKSFDFYYENAKQQGEGEYWECPREADYVIDEKTSFRDADLILRAFMGYECIYEKDGKRLALQHGRAVKGNSRDSFLKIDGGYIDAEKIREL